MRTPIFVSLIASILASATLICQSKSLGSGSDPAFSSDSRRVAYKYGNSIAVVGQDGKNIKCISRLVWDDEPSWSPSGRQIVFQSYGRTWSKKRKFAIWIIDSDGANPHRLIEPASDGDQRPCWSPSGKRIVWTHGKRLWISNASGSNAHPLTSEPAVLYESAHDWSPDSKTIIYFREDDYNAGHYVCLIDADGKNQRRFNAIAFASDAKWSRKTGYIFYTDETSLFKVKPDGSNGVRICSFGTPFQVDRFDISFDERTVVFSVGGAEVDEEVFLLDLSQASK